MRIYKFGGASVKDADGVKNLAHVLQYEGIDNTLVVISAMGKMTNAFERIVDSYFYQKDDLKNNIDFVHTFHFDILKELFQDEAHTIYTTVTLLLGELSAFMASNTSKNYNFIYDQLVGYGELLSTNIVSAYLTEIGIKNQWLDVRECIKTNRDYRDAKIDWKQTETFINKNVNTSQLNITQGFLGGYDNHTTTIGREGSDYTAGVFAYCLNAKSVTIWKDVEGVLNADPRVFDKTQLLHKISYTEAIEMAFYGASVIHPKTLQPLEQKNIPLYVRSFEHMNKKGTCVSKEIGIEPNIPCYIVKTNQILISISAKDFSFMVEDNISEVFKKLHEHKLKVNLIQNSAISFSVCIEDKFHNFDIFLDTLKSNFNIHYYKNVTLYTIRHFNDDAINIIKKRGKAIIRQINTETAQLVIQE